MSEMREYSTGLFCWVDLMAHDLDAAARWYGELFGWEARQEDTHGGPPYVMFLKDGAAVAGAGQMSDEMKAQGVPPVWNSYVAVEDAAALEPKVKELGGQVTVPTMDVMEAGKLAYFTDPVGASFAVWQAGAHHGARRVNEPGAFSWNELNVKDPAPAKAFYGELFGWTFEENPNPQTSYWVIQNDGRPNGGIIQMTEEWGDMPPVWAVYFAVADCDAAATRVTDAGGKVFVPPTDIPPAGRFSVVSDPQGGVFTVIQLASED